MLAGWFHVSPFLNLSWLGWNDSQAMYAVPSRAGYATLSKCHGVRSSNHKASGTAKSVKSETLG